MDRIAHELCSTVVRENDARHVAAQEERGAFRHRIRADIVEGKHVALRKAVQAHLRTMKQVRSFRAGTFGEGEMGVTIVTLR